MLPHKSNPSMVLLYNNACCVHPGPRKSKFRNPSNFKFCKICKYQEMFVIQRLNGLDTGIFPWKRSLHQSLSPSKIPENRNSRRQPHSNHLVSHVYWQGMDGGPTPQINGTSSNLYPPQPTHPTHPTLPPTHCSFRHKRNCVETDF